MSAAGNVVRLPTAAPRKVDNYRWAAQRKAAVAARKAEPWRGEFMFPGQRKAIETARHLQHVERGPLTELVVGILHTLDDVGRVKVAAALMPGLLAGNETAKQAEAVLHSTRMTWGQQADLMWAIKRVDEGGDSAGKS